MGTVYIKEGLYEIGENNEVYLLGSECSRCGERVFPARPICPRCGARDLRQVRLSREGEIYTYTTIRQAPPNWQGPVPYTIVVVKLDDSTVVETHLAEPVPEKVEIGARVEVVLEKLHDRGEDELFVHKFRLKEQEVTE